MFWFVRNSIRLCVDFRKVNEVMRHDAQPLPNMDLTLQSLSNKRVFSTFDLVSGFWQVPLEKHSKPKTAFAILDELLEFQVMPYGLANAPACFQRLMHVVLKDLIGENVFVYIDDVIIATPDWESHVILLRKVFQRLRENGLRFKASKCKIGQEEVQYLGHIIGRKGLRADPDKVVKIENCPRPASISELRTFLGMTGYYRKFVKNFARVASPLYDLTNSTVKWQWGEAQEKAFLALKAALCSAPILAQPDVAAAQKGERQFILYVDASKQGVGGVLCQEGPDKQLYPLHFFSQRLNKAQTRYHPTDLEAYAIKQSVQKFRPYVYGLKLVVRTDHQALVSLLRRHNLAERTMRWALELQDENLVFEYVKGRANCVADALSRGPVVLSEEQEEGPAGYGLDRVINEILTETKDEWQKTLAKNP